MHTKTVIVGSAIGLHARPAAIISEAVVKAGVPVTLSGDGGEPVDAGSALMIMTLGAGNGALVTVAAEDEATVNAIAELVRRIWTPTSRATSPADCRTGRSAEYVRFDQRLSGTRTTADGRVPLPDFGYRTGSGCRRAAATLACGRKSSLRSS